MFFLSVYTIYINGSHGLSLACIDWFPRCNIFCFSVFQDRIVHCCVLTAPLWRHVLCRVISCTRTTPRALALAVRAFVTSGALPRDLLHPYDATCIGACWPRLCDVTFIAMSLACAFLTLSAFPLAQSVVCDVMCISDCFFLGKTRKEVGAAGRGRGGGGRQTPPGVKPL